MILFLNYLFHLKSFLIIFLDPESKIQKNKLILPSKYCTSTICDKRNKIKEIIHDFSKIEFDIALFESMNIFLNDKKEIIAIGIIIKMAPGIP